MKEKALGLEEIKTRSLEMLKYVDAVCKEHNLKYYLAAGTLLGAVRHKGFIPWDDDIDIMMPRNDYEQLIHIFPENDKYVFLNIHNKVNIYCPYGKITDINTKKIEPLRSKYHVIGVDIDVFPIDNYPNDYEESIRWCKEIENIQLKKDSLLAPYAKGRNLIRTIVRNVFIFFKHLVDDLGIVSVRKYNFKLDYLSQKYNSAKTNYCGIASIAAYGVKKRNHKSIFSKTVNVEFEGQLFPAPIGYHEYLTDYYGDYMKMPPLEKRQTHHTYKAYSLE